MKKWTPLIVVASFVGVALTGVGCIENVERADRATKPGERIDREPLPMEVDPIMRGTIAGESVLVGFDATVVRGYGLVVGLTGTGSRIMPAEVRAYLLQEMARRGVGDPTIGNELSPEGMLNSNDVAAVIVEGVIQPGSTKDSRFDVRVYNVPGSGATSLEGGRLWTTALRPGPILPGNKQAQVLAEARGPLFVNPFVDPSPSRNDGINRTSGRILDGGRVVKDMPLKLRLATPSHNRALTLQSAINSVFPREPGQSSATAHGKSDDTILITVPPSFRSRPQEFVQLLRHLPIRVDAIEQTAEAVRRSLLANPGAAGAASWRWQSLGKKALASVQDLYDYPEEQPRFAALQAGAKLDDPLCVPPLIEMARNGTLENRFGAIELLGAMGRNPAIDLGLRPLLDDPEVDIRLKAYEALEKRRDPTLLVRSLDDKFDVVLVPSRSPMVYVQQSGRPKIVLFGEDLEIDRPTTVMAWGNRFMLKGEPDEPKIEVFYRPRDDGPPMIDRVNPLVSDFVAYLGHRPSPESPEAGLGMSYSETIGALHEIWKAGYLGRTDFKAEQDRVLAAIIRREREQGDFDRPEFDDEEDSSAAVPALTRSRESDLGSIPVPSLAPRSAPADTVPR
ncbi:MAG: flagellar basal body P-ring protein FlgI [Phycisphaeraceae bacterium]|nr:flagellar basal body P-ring protein FlgI [Phycisphaeraceae bacterium]